MAYEGKRHKIDTRYIHHEKEDMPTRNNEQHSDPTREIGQIPGVHLDRQLLWKKKRKQLDNKSKTRGG
jgi:hypothetical protein